MRIKITACIYHFINSVILNAIRGSVNLEQDTSYPLVPFVKEASILQNLKFIHRNRLTCLKICIILPAILCNIVENIGCRPF